MKYISAATGVLTLVTAIFWGIVWAADQRYVTNEAMVLRDYRELNREITFIEIKIKTGEATKTEQIYLQTLKRDRDDLEKTLK